MSLRAGRVSSLLCRPLQPRSPPDRGHQVGDRQTSSA